MKCKMTFKDKYSADSVFSITAPGFIAGTLYWANEESILENWMPFAYFPIDAAGKGNFYFKGRRAVPAKATHVCVKVVRDDLQHVEKTFIEIPEEYRSQPMTYGIRICAMSDLHLSSKPWALKQAFEKAKEADILLLAGDMTNDGYCSQFEKLKMTIEEVLPELPIFSVRGNHDIPREGNGVLRDEKVHWESSDTRNYMSFQNWLFERIEHGKKREFLSEYQRQDGSDGAYAVSIGNEIAIIGLQAVTDHRQFLFKDAAQLKWLDKYLKETEYMKWRFILCHAPLLHHNPKREPGKNNPYLNRDKELQEILDRHGNVVFISGHTHLSMNHPDGCVEWDDTYGNLYINDGSIRSTDLMPGEMMQPAEWKEGNCLHLTISEREMEIVTQSIKNNKKHARGYYRIRK